MPQRLKTRCRHVGCPELTDAGYCDKHRAKAHQAYNRQRQDKAEQDIYNSYRWQQLRKAKREANPFCERCADKGIVKQAELVHHRRPIKDGGDPWAWENLESVCGSCQAVEHRGKK